MRSYLMTGLTILGELFKKLWILLKSICTAVQNNRELCKKILIVQLFVLTWIVGARYGQGNVLIPDPKIVIVHEPQDPALEEMLNSYKEEKTARENNLCSIAKVLYGYRYNTEKDLEGICWVILNRVDNQSEFRNSSTIYDVVNCPNQWMGYSEDNPVLDDLYNIANVVLTSYESDGKHMFGKEYLYFEWRDDYIVFKSELYDSGTCKTWRNY